MHIFDPTGELHMQRMREKRHREWAFAVLWGGYLLIIGTLAIILGTPQ